MQRAFSLAVLLLVAAHGAAADEPTTPASPPAVKVNAPAGVGASVGSNQNAKRPAGRGKPDAGAGEPAGSPGQSTPSGDVKMSGMSILGNEDAPKTLALVPWKSSQLGDMPSVSRLLDAAAQPVDKDVFLRELAYYSFKAGSK